MEEWQNEIATVVKDLTAMFEGFNRQVTELVEEVTTEATEIFSLQWDELTEAFAVIWQELESDLESPTSFNWDLPISTHPKPDPAIYPACVGCLNYNGSVYGGNLLVCGMHPYGCASDTCNDWEGENDLN